MLCSPTAAPKGDVPLSTGLSVDLFEVPGGNLRFCQTAFPPSLIWRSWDPGQMRLMGKVDFSHNLCGWKAEKQAATSLCTFHFIEQNFAISAAAVFSPTHPVSQVLMRLLIVTKFSFNQIKSDKTDWTKNNKKVMSELITNVNWMFFIDSGLTDSTCMKDSGSFEQREKRWCLQQQFRAAE